ncbi:phytoene desaturase [Myxococcota bacterium]|nr:phytoene desaturase [Myxococcota bacterium]
MRRAAVIGSGFGGLAIAIRLQAAGIQTTIFEARDRPGGRAYTYEDAGFVFDAGPTVITAPPCLEELFLLAGRSMADHVELLPVSPFYRLVWEDGRRFDYVNDADRLLEQVRAFNARDEAGYVRFLEYSRSVFSIGYEALVDRPFLRFADLVRATPHLVALRADRSVYDAVSRFIEDEHLRQAFSFHSLLVGGDPFETSAIYALIHHLERTWGVFFPRGGTGALVRALARLFTELGGELLVDTPVARIEPGGTRARPRLHVTTHGARRPFELVVSNADVHDTYARLLAGSWRARATAARLRRLDWSMSLFVLHFGVDRTYPDVAHHTVLFGRRYRELLRDVFEGWELPEDQSLYLHCPTVTDPSLAPPGCSTFYVLSPVPNLLRGRLDWPRIAAQYAERLFVALERHLPELRRHVVTHRWFTPFDFEHVLGAHGGNAFSVAPTLAQSAYFRPHNRDPLIPGLYLVGAGTHPGAGVPGVVNSARATMRAIEEDLGT